jgi:WD40 repeat protein
MTPAFCSPEQHRQEALDFRSDVWSWALCMLVMFIGKVDWKIGVEGPEVLERYLKDGPLNKDAPAMPTPVAELLSQCLQMNPEHRPKSMAAVAAYLIGLYEDVMGVPFPLEVPRAAEAQAHSLNNRAVSLMDLGKAAEAVPLWKKALKIEANLPQAAYNLALLLWRAGQMSDEEVIRRVDEVRLLYGESLMPIFQLVQIHLERGDCVTAIQILEDLEKAKGKRPDVTEALRRSNNLIVSSRRIDQCIEGHADAVKCLSISSNGDFALSGSEDNTVCQWQLAEGECDRVFAGHTGSVEAISMTPDERYFLSAGQDRSFRLWERATGRSIRQFEVSRDASKAIALSPDCRRALSRHVGNTLAMWDMESGSVTREVTAHTNWIDSLKMSVDGRYAVSGGHDGTVKFWEVDTMECLRTFAGHTGPVLCLAMSENGDYVLSGSADRTVRVWECATGRCLRVMKGHRDAVRAIATSADATIALTASADKTVRYWIVPQARCLRTFEGHSDEVTAVALPREGRLGLSAGRDRMLLLWDLGERGVQSVAPFMLCRAQASESALSAETNFKRTLGQAATLLQSGDVVQASRAVNHARTIRGYQRNADALSAWAALYAYLPKSGLNGAWEERALDGHEGGVNDIKLSADGRFALSGGSDSQVKLWNTQTGKCLRTLNGHSAPVKAVAMSGDATLALSGGEDQTIILWDMTQGDSIMTFGSVAGSVESLDLSPDGRLLLSGGMDMRLWETAKGRVLQSYEGHNADVEVVCWSPDSRYAISGSPDHTVKIWNAATAECLETLEGHTGSVRALCISGDGRFLMSASSNMWSKPGRMRLWSMATGESLQVFEGHTAGISSVAMTADSRYAFSGSTDTTVRMWEMATGECVRTFGGHTAPVTAVAVTPDGRRILSCDEQDVIQVRHLDWRLGERPFTELDEASKPFLEQFLLSRQPYSEDLPEDYDPVPEEAAKALARKGRPEWTDEDVAMLRNSLGYAGFGRAPAEEIEAELEAMATKLGRRTFFGLGR